MADNTQDTKQEESKKERTQINKTSYERAIDIRVSRKNAKAAAYTVLLILLLGIWCLVGHKPSSTLIISICFLVGGFLFLLLVFLGGKREKDVTYWRSNLEESGVTGWMPVQWRFYSKGRAWSPVIIGFFGIIFWALTVYGGL